MLLNWLQIWPISAYMQLSCVLQVDKGAWRTRRSRLEPTAPEGGRDGGRRGRGDCRLTAKCAVRAVKASPQTGLDEEEEWGGGVHSILGADQPASLSAADKYSEGGKRAGGKNILQNSTTKSRIPSM